MLDIASFTWNILKDIISGIINIISFIKDLALNLPNFLSFLPTEISIILLSTISILTIIFIFRFVK